MEKRGNRGSLFLDERSWVTLIGPMRIAFLGVVEMVGLTH